MTSSIRILLAQIATFEAQHRAGLNPPCSALAEFFHTAREARADVEAFDRGLTPPPPVTKKPSVVEKTLQLRPIDEAVSVRVDVPIGRVARALLVELGRLDGDPERVIGGRRPGA